MENQRIIVNNDIQIKSDLKIVCGLKILFYVAVNGLIKRTGLKSKLLSYAKKPNLGDLKSIMSRIKNGIHDKSGDPSSWIKLAALFMI